MAADTVKECLFGPITKKNTFFVFYIENQPTWNENFDLFFKKHFNIFTKTQQMLRFWKQLFAVGDFSNVKALKVGALSGGKEKLKYAHNKCKKLSPCNTGTWL